MARLNELFIALARHDFQGSRKDAEDWITSIENERDAGWILAARIRKLPDNPAQGIDDEKLEDMCRSLWRQAINKDPLTRAANTPTVATYHPTPRWMKIALGAVLVIFIMAFMGYVAEQMSPADKKEDKSLGTGFVRAIADDVDPPIFMGYVHVYEKLRREWGGVCTADHHEDVVILDARVDVEVGVVRYKVRTRSGCEGWVGHYFIVPNDSETEERIEEALR